MKIKILQINLNCSRVAQDLCYKFMYENHIDIVCISEPHSVLGDYRWIGEKDGLAAVMWNPKAYKGNVKGMKINKNYVVVQADDITIVSVYIYLRMLT